MGKLGFFDQSYHIPLIIRAPDGSAGGGGALRGVKGVRGVRVGALTESIDVMPTILEFMGQAPPLQCDGSSLLPFVLRRTLQPPHVSLKRDLDKMAPPPPGWRSGVHYEFDYGEYSGGRLQLPPPTTSAFARRHPLGRQEATQAVEALGLTIIAVYRTAHFKLVHFSEPSFPPLLFDMVTDPGETRNLAASPEHMGTLTSLVQQLLSLRMRRSGGRDLSERTMGASL